MKAFDRLKQEWEENPTTVIGVGALAASAAAGLLKAVTEANNSRTWAKEVKRRQKL